LHKNKEMYVQMLIAYIDKGVPVFLYGFGGPPFSVIVGYEEHGKTLLYLTGDARMVIHPAQVVCIWIPRNFLASG
jgi:hypothetical protein